jgi:hypothetical protein
MIIGVEGSGEKERERELGKDGDMQRRNFLK